MTRLVPAVVIAALLWSGTAMAVDIPMNIDRVAVPNGAFPLADYGGVLPGKTLQLTVTAPPHWTLLTADCSGGGDSPWRTVNIALFKAFIKPSFRGVHNGSFNGTMGTDGTSGGGPVPWNGNSVATVIKIVSETTLEAADGTPNDRTDIGVNEQVTFKTDPPTNASWQISSGNPRSGSGTSIFWTAPITGIATTVTATVGSRDYTMSVTVWPPYSAQRKRKLSETSGYTPGRAGAQMRITECVLEPSNVNFTRIQRREKDNEADGVFGWFSNDYFTKPRPPSGNNRLHHSASGQWVSIIILNGKNVSSSVDTAGYDPPGLRPNLIPGGFTAGGFNWNIPYVYRASTGGGEIPFTTVQEKVKMANDGTMTVTKDDSSICTVTRSPNQP